MKRIIPLMLALILLAACGAPASEPGASPAETPAAPTTGAQESPEQPGEASATPSAAPEPVAVEFALPDPGFKPDSWWLAESFGDAGQALMLTRSGEDGALDLKCWFNSMTERENRPELECGSFTALGYSGGGAAMDEEGALAYPALEGDTLTVTYSGGDYAATPERFTRVSEDEALEAFRAMPYNDEAVLPIPSRMTREEFEALPGLEREAEDRYTYDGMTLGLAGGSFSGDAVIWTLHSENAASAPSVRGVSIGCAANDALACFPSVVTDIAEVTEEQSFYGGDFYARGSVAPDGSGYVITVNDGRSAVRFFSGADGIIYAISWQRMV